MKLWLLLVLGITVALKIEKYTSWLSSKLYKHALLPIWRILAPTGGWIWQITRMVKQ